MAEEEREREARERSWICCGLQREGGPPPPTANEKPKTSIDPLILNPLSLSFPPFAAPLKKKNKKNLKNITGRGPRSLRRAPPRHPLQPPRVGRALGLQPRHFVFVLWRRRQPRRGLPAHRLRRRHRQQEAVGRPRPRRLPQDGGRRDADQREMLRDPQGRRRRRRRRHQGRHQELLLHAGAGGEQVLRLRLVLLG